MTDDREKGLVLLARLCIQKNRRFRAATDEIEDARLEIVQMWREPEGSERLMQARLRLHNAEMRLRHDRYMAESAERIAEEYLDIPVTDGPAVTLTSNQRVA